jgi:hypothetical protein
VSHHFRRVLLEVAEDRIDAPGGPGVPGRPDGA